MVSGKITEDQLLKLRLDRYAHIGLIGWIFYVVLLAVTTTHVFLTHTSLARTEFLAVILIGLIWWLRPEREY